MKMEFDAQFREYAGAVERRLEACLELPAQSPYGKLLEAMRYSLLSAGKRVRGVLCLAFYHLFAQDYTAALPFAAALEMVHAYSLVHDDLPCMDDDDMRRGKPSCHVAFGEATALLAGDALLALAFETAASCDSVCPERALAALLCIARAAGAHGMVGGQAMDLAGEGKEMTGDALDAVNARKTGALFQASAETPCLLAGADQRKREAARAFAANLGLAFQIVDDVLDITADETRLGKPVGSDAAKGKPTYAAIYGVPKCRERTALLSQAATQALSVFEGETSFLKGLVGRLAEREF